MIFRPAPQETADFGFPKDVLVVSASALNFPDKSIIEKSSSQVKPLSWTMLDQNQNGDKNGGNGSKYVQVENRSINKALEMIIFISNFVGTIPLTYSKSTRTFKVDPRSKTFWVTTIAACWFLFVWIWYFLLFGLRRPFYESEMDKPLMKMEAAIKNDNATQPSAVSAVFACIQVAQVLLPATQVYGITIGWLQAPKLAKFLNDWATFDLKFSQTFPNLNYYDDKHRVNIQLWSWTWSFSSDWLLYLFFLAPFFFTGRMIQIFDVKYVSSLDIVFGLSTSLELFSLDLLDDVKTLLLYRSSRAAFRKIHAGIKFTVESCSSSQVYINEKMANKWKSLVIQARSQVDLLNKYEGPTELAFILFCIILFTTCLFLFLNISWENRYTVPFCIMWGTFTSIQLFRFYIKVTGAELITHEEQKIGALLTYVDVNNSDSITLVQVKFIHDLISESPTRIQFGKYVKFNKGLLLTVFNQVVTYLIVMMQFVQS